MQAYSYYSDLDDLANRAMIVPAIADNVSTRILDITLTSVGGRASFSISLRYKDQTGTQFERYLMKEVSVFEGTPFTLEGLIQVGAEVIIRTGTTGSVTALVRGYVIPPETGKATRVNYYRTSGLVMPVHDMVIPTGGYGIVDVFVSAVSLAGTVNVLCDKVGVYAETKLIRRKGLVGNGSNVAVRRLITTPGDKIWVQTTPGEVDVTIMALTFDNKEDTP